MQLGDSDTVHIGVYGVHACCYCYCCSRQTIRGEAENNRSVSDSGCNTEREVLCTTCSSNTETSLFPNCLRPPVLHRRVEIVAEVEVDSGVSFSFLDQ